MSELAERRAVLAEARSWLRTPWHHEARAKGAGVDCAQFLIAVYAACGLVPEFRPEHYPSDWMLHRTEQKFLHYLLQHTVKVEMGLPGDIAMFSFGRTDSHGAIVVAMPDELNALQIVHAYRPERGVVLSGVTGDLAARFAGFYRLKGWAA